MEGLTVDLKLAKIPDRTPVKIGIAVLPDLHERLCQYSAAYVAAYGTDVPVAELIPPMLAAFLDSDRDFLKFEKTVKTP